MIEPKYGKQSESRLAVRNSANDSHDAKIIPEKHQDTSISLHPLSFEEAIISEPSVQADSPVEDSCKTNVPAPEQARFR